MEYASSLQSQPLTFITILLGNTSCDFQWSNKAIYIHEFGWTILEVDEITFIHPNWIHSSKSVVILSQDLGAF